MLSLIKAFPDSYEAYYNLADFYYRLGQNDLAISNFEKSFQLMDKEILNSKKDSYVLNKEKSEKSLLKAQAYQMLEIYDKAVPAFQTYLAFNSTNAIALTNYGYCLLETGKPDEALINFEKAFKIDENEIDTIIGLISTNYLLKNTSNSKKYIKLLEKKFKNYKATPNLLQTLSNEGYFYSPKIVSIWNEAVAK